MRFFLLWISFVMIELFVCIIFGPAMTLVSGFVFVIVCACLGEYTKIKTPRGKKQIKQNYEREKKIEEYWGTIDYWEDK